jgi:hypothetical protein
MKKLQCYKATITRILPIVVLETDPRAARRTIQKYLEEELRETAHDLRQGRTRISPPHLIEDVHGIPAGWHDGEPYTPHHYSYAVIEDIVRTAGTDIEKFADPEIEWEDE